MLYFQTHESNENHIFRFQQLESRPQIGLCRTPKNIYTFGWVSKTAQCSGLFHSPEARWSTTVQRCGSSHDTQRQTETQGLVFHKFINYEGQGDKSQDTMWCFSQCDSMSLGKCGFSGWLLWSVVPGGMYEKKVRRQEERWAGEAYDS